MTPQPTNLERVLVPTLLGPLLILDDLPESQIELETAVNLQESIAGDILGLDDASRARLIAIASEPGANVDPERLRLALEAIGLLVAEETEP